MNLADKSIVVTGGSGFLGRHVVAALNRRGCERVIVPRSLDYDLVDPDSVRAMYREARPQIVIHLAAVVGGIGANESNPARFYYDNLMMGSHLIHEGWRANIEKLVAVGTVCSYPADTPVPFREEALWDGYPEPTNAPYGLAKKMLLVQCQAYRRQYDLNGVFLLPANLYGPGDNVDLATSHVIPAVIRKFLEARASDSEAVVVWGDGTPTREFLHVRDAAEGIVQAAERYDGAEPINLGTGQEVAIADLVEQIRLLCDYDGAVVWDTSKPNGQARRCLDVSRAKDLLGFEASVGLAEGLAETAAWVESELMGSR